MLEYGETYLSENRLIPEEMYARMSPEAKALAQQMATEDLYEDEDEGFAEAA
mgnify:FL=1